VIHISPTTLHNAERGFRELAPWRIQILEQFYFEKIAERLKRIGKLLAG
jgi:hypothetical protein